MAEIFHLSLPVSNLQNTRQFYEKYLGAKIGRVTGEWLDLWLFGAQITIQKEPQNAGPGNSEKLHLGGTISWQEWDVARRRLANLGAAFVGEPFIDDVAGQAKMYLKDPDGYVIELKAYKDVQKTLRPPA